VTVAVSLAHYSHGLLREISILLRVDPLPANRAIIFEDQKRLTCSLSVMHGNVWLAFSENPTNPSTVQSRGSEFGNYELATGGSTRITAVKGALCVCSDAMCQKLDNVWVPQNGTRILFWP